MQHSIRFCHCMTLFTLYASKCLCLRAATLRDDKISTLRLAPPKYLPLSPPMSPALGLPPQWVSSSSHFAYPPPSSNSIMSFTTFLSIALPLLSQHDIYVLVLHCILLFLTGRGYHRVLLYTIINMHFETTSHVCGSLHVCTSPSTCSFICCESHSTKT